MNQRIFHGQRNQGSVFCFFILFSLIASFHFPLLGEVIDSNPSTPSTTETVNFEAGKTTDDGSTATFPLALNLAAQAQDSIRADESPLVQGSDSEFLGSSTALFPPPPTSLAKPQSIGQTISNFAPNFGISSPTALGNPGRIAVLGDDWPNMDYVWSFNGSPETYSLNVFSWLTKGKPAPRLLVDPTYLYRGPFVDVCYLKMLAALTSHGYSYIVSQPNGWTLEYMKGFDAVLLFYSCAPVPDLNAYIKGGGGAYILGGFVDAPSVFNQLLQKFDMSFSPVLWINYLWLTNFVPHQVTNGVSTLLTVNGNPINLLSSKPKSLCNQNGANWLVVYETELEVLDVQAIPGKLFIGADGATSGIIFKAKTTDVGQVAFKVLAPNGSEIYSAASDSAAVGSEYFAKLAWWGDSSLVDGIYTIVAATNFNSVSNTFEIKHVPANFLGMGRWARVKDPSGILPPDPVAQGCPATTWDEIAGGRDGYYRGLAVQDPVNIESGNFIQAETDLVIRSRLSLNVTRIYNSLDTHVGLFGRGWSSPYFSRLEFLNPDVLFVNSDGSRVVFKKQGDTYRCPEGSDLKLVLEIDTDTWVLSHPQGTQWTFDTNGKLTRMAKACCGMGALDAILLEYDSNGLLHRVTNPAGQWFEFVNANGRCSQLSDSTGRTVHYSYDSDNLVTQTDPIGRVTRYSYQEDGFLTQIQKPGNRNTTVSYVDRRVRQISNPDGTVSQFAWDFLTPKLSLTDLNGTIHEYGFSPAWQLKSYSVPTLGLNKTFAFSGSALVGYQNSQGSQESFSYSSDGLPSGRTDALGNATNYEFHPTFHQLTKKTDALGRQWQYSWCARGNLQTEVDPAGGVSSFSYDSHNNRVSKTDQLGRLQRWVYDSSGNYLIQAINPEGGISSFSYDNRGNMLTSSDPLGRTTSFQFDILDRLTKTIYPDGRFVEMVYDEAGNVVTRRDNLGRETHYTFDLADRLTTLTRPDGTTFGYVYNAAGQKISEMDSLGRVTRFEYSPIGLLTRTTCADGAFETFSYDTESRLTSKTNELGQTSNLEYDVLGRLLATVDPTGSRWESRYDSVGRKTTDKDPLNRVTAYQFDNLDRITKVIRPDSSFTSNSFDSIGNLLSTVDALGNRWEWLYDNLNRQVRAIQPNSASSTTAFDAAGQVIAETDAINRTTRYSFDNSGRRTATTDALGNVWHNFFDNAGRLTAVKDPMGAVSSMTYDIMDRVISQSDAIGNINSFEFDNAGRRVAKVDAMGRRSITAFDLRDRVTAEVDPEGHTVSFGYNLAGQRVSLTDGANRTWRWDFDSLGRVTAEYDPLGNMNRYVFDSVGNRISWTNARNLTTTYAFNEMNRLNRVSYPDGTLATMSYDLEGRELARSGAAGTVTKTWDSVGIMTSETFVVGSDRPGAPGLGQPFSKTWRYQFDLAGNRTSALDPEGGIFIYRYSALNQLVYLDPPGRNDEVTLSYDAAGRQVSETKPNVYTENVFDPAGRLLSTTHAKTKGQKPVLAARQYTYNQVGNRTSQTDEDGKITLYEFNRADWLTKANYPDGNQVSWAYNGAGDRVSETIGTSVPILYSFDSAGRMISRGSDSFTFDNDGNLIQSLENGIENRNTWDSSNRLTRVDKFSGAASFTEVYSFEPENWRRLSRTADGKTYLNSYDNADEALEYELVSGRTGPTLEMVRQFISGPGTDDHKFSVKGRRQYGMLTDALGSVIGLTTPSGRVLAKIPYSAWGELLQAPDGTTTTTTAASLAELEAYFDRVEASRSIGGTTYDPYATGRKFGPALSPHLFTMRRFEPLTRNWWHRNRFMNPKHGRFITKDPIGFAGGLNLYSYANQNPVIYTDPFGLVKLFQSGGGTFIFKIEPTDSFDIVYRSVQAFSALRPICSGLLVNGTFFDPAAPTGLPFGDVVANSIYYQFNLNSIVPIPRRQMVSRRVGFGRLRNGQYLMITDEDFRQNPNRFDAYLGGLISSDPITRQTQIAPGNLRPAARTNRGALVLQGGTTFVYFKTNTTLNQFVNALNAFGGNAQLLDAGSSAGFFFRGSDNQTLSVPPPRNVNPTWLLWETR